LHSVHPLLLAAVAALAGAYFAAAYGWATPEAIPFALATAALVPIAGGALAMVLATGGFRSRSVERPDRK
jgi:hypothetical protein